ncbi:metallophosphoesterase family protein [Daejeonella lutea]|uniref:Calcineurin-like phosphoesterase n=1 Tax=Daejeonella lutea TaxID=572036 RepID=A0A1T5APF0_9SPHI|nr:metallophosphoesterase [Daejeonella lutea]SKB36755.1 Calcineurin-like phosphoesterase [Daejeonella lutea]
MQFRNAYIAVTLLLAIILTAFVAENTIHETNPRARKIRKEQKDKPIKICVISDLNASYGSTQYPYEVSQVIQRMGEIDPDIILCSGDMVAGQKASLTEQNITDMWASFKTTVLNPINRLGIPFGFTVGNHDASPSFSKDRAISKDFWKENVKNTNLTFVDSTNYPFYYSYIKNNVFIMSWDAAGAEIKPEVYRWMKAQMEGKIARNARLKILIGHLPLYAIVDSKNKPGEVNSDPAAALEFFKTYGLDLYISGHQHAYYPSKKGEIRFLNMGAIGDGPRKLIGNTAEAAKSYTIIDIPVKNARNFTYQTYTPDNVKIELSSLPDSIIGFNGTSRKDH